jgi:hypothetical protein
MAKYCKLCGETDLDRLCKNKRVPLGVDNICYKCHYIRNRITMLTGSKNRGKTESVREYQREYSRTETGRVVRLNNNKIHIAKIRGGRSLMGLSDRECMRRFYNAAKKVSIVQGKQYDVDHIYPLSQGGDHSLDNVQLLEHILNLNKSDRLDSGIVGCSYKALKNGLSQLGKV